MGFFKRTKKIKRIKNTILALDIGTEFVKALIYDIDESKKIGIVRGVGRQKQDLNHMHAGAVADIAGVAKCCQKAIAQAKAMAKIEPDQVIMGIAGELVKGSTTSFVYKRKKPQEPIDQAELKNIIQKVQWKSFDQVRQQLAEQTGRSEVEIKLINALITDIKIDGYRITNPLGFQGKEMFISIFNIYAPLIHLSALQRISEILDLNLLSIVAEPYAVARATNIKPDKGAIFIDVGGGTTDIALIRRLGLEETKSLALAGRAFTKRIAESLNIDYNKAEDLKTRYGQKDLSLSIQKKIKDIFRSDALLWLDGLELILEEFNQQDFFPTVILLSGGGSNLPEIENSLSRDALKKKWMAKFPFTQSFSVQFVALDQIWNMKDKTNCLQAPQDIMPLALASLGVEFYLEKPNLLSTTLRRAVKMIQR
jgi:cell division protein FtsA